MSSSARADEAAVHLEFDDNRLLPQLFGSHNSHLARIEQQLDVTLNSRGNEVTIIGPAPSAELAGAVLSGLYDRLKKGLDVDRDEVDGALRLMAMGGTGTTGQAAKAGTVAAEDSAIQTRKRLIMPRSPAQVKYIRAIDANDLVFGLGPAGTGKTYLAVAKAVEKLIAGEVDRIILSRPAVEAGEQLGFLPGDMRDKVDPYLRPIYDALGDMLPGNQVAKMIDSGKIEIAPLAFMRGRTLANAFVILDEAQNTTRVQMKMLLTRLGGDAQMVVTGDLTQVDLPPGIRGGLAEAVEILQGVDGVAFVEFSDVDVVRHPLVGDIIRAYERLNKAAAANEKRRGEK